MSEERDSATDLEEPPPSDDGVGLDDVDVRDMLRAAMRVPDSEPKNIARGVQRRIREDTKGRYFSDGWSTASAPKATFLITSILMLLVVVLAWFLLTPKGIELLTR
jgi:hypothetical protein